MVLGGFVSPMKNEQLEFDFNRPMTFFDLMDATQKVRIRPIENIGETWNWIRPSRYRTADRQAEIEQRQNRNRLRRERYEDWIRQRRERSVNDD